MPMGYGKCLFDRYVRGSRVLVPMRYVLESIDIAPVQIRNFYPYPPPPVSSKNNHNNFVRIFQVLQYLVDVDNIQTFGRQFMLNYVTSKDF